MVCLDLSYKLVDLELESKTPAHFTLCLKYFRNIVFIVTKGQNRKIEVREILFISAATSSFSGRGIVANPPTPPPPPKLFLHTRVARQRVVKLDE